MKKAKSSFRTEVLTAANMLRELADFVENYHRSSNAETPADLLRTKLLILKQCCKDGIKPLTVAEIAAMLNVPETARWLLPTPKNVPQVESSHGERTTDK